MRLGILLLLISGQGSDHKSWDGVRDGFAGRYRVIVCAYQGTTRTPTRGVPTDYIQRISEGATSGRC